MKGLVFLLVLALTACGGGGSTGGVSFPPGEQAFDAGVIVLRPITDLISDVQTIDGTIHARLMTGPPPKSRNSVPTARLLAGGFTIPGGSKIIGLNSGTAPFSRALVGALGATGYYEITGLPPGTFNTLIATVPQTAPASFGILVAIAVDEIEPIGPYQQLSVILTTVGTGEVQVSLAWDALSDLDLHVVQPNGTEIYYGHRTDPATLGTLDLDSNAACSIDGKNNENVTWQNGTPLRGEYIVRADNWDSCGHSPIYYVATVNLLGRGSKTFIGKFTDPGDKGRSGSGVEVARFTY